MIHPPTWLGIALILIGLALVLLPIIGNYVDFSQVPSWLIFVYPSDGFYFATSPILIVFSLIALMAHFWLR